MAVLKLHLSAGEGEGLVEWRYLKLHLSAGREKGGRKLPERPLRGARKVPLPLWFECLGTDCFET